MNIENKFLLVCLQLIIVLLLMLVNVEGLADMRSRRRSLLSDDDMNSPLRTRPLSKYFTLSSTSPVARAYRLHNLRAKADVVMDKDNRVSATALQSDDRGELGLESLIKDDEVRTRIRGLVTDTYLCFNHKGRLVAKHKARARGAKCEFIEDVNPETGSSSFKSALHPSWHVGFNQRGQGLLGSSYEDSECLECFLFYKTSFNTPPMRKNPSSSPTGHLTSRNFDPHRHNQRIGEIHPGLNSDFLSSFPFSSSQFSSRRRHPSTTTTTTTSTPPPKPTKQPSRHRLRHRKKKHRHQHHHNNQNVEPTARPHPIPTEA